jgi:hypothetical protein
MQENRRVRKSSFGNMLGLAATAALLGSPLIIRRPVTHHLGY